MLAWAGVRASITTPPAKSMPRCRPGWKNSTTEAVERIAETIRPMNRPRMKRKRVLSGTRRSMGRSMGSDRKQPGPVRHVPARDQQAGEQPGGEEGGGDADGD